VKGVFSGLASSERGIRSWKFVIWTHRERRYWSGELSK